MGGGGFSKGESERGTGADTGFPEKGGGGQDIHKHTHTPWTLSAWRHPPSKKWQIPPLLGIHKHPPLDIARVT